MIPRQPQPEPKYCAIYTRKSVSNGLDQEFNTLECQRALCSAYITSQRHKGWTELARQYDDGGYSGANLSRPALQELLADVERGLIDVVVVYKLDRMTRTLLDFVRLLDLFERHGVVFVSITQNFDTTDAMGRLILNVLLTFAQFEREMCSDRIRDKIRAMRQAGLWACGVTPVGYEVVHGKLRINKAEAQKVRFIFERYLELENAAAVYDECRRAGFRTKQWRTKSGRIKGGRPISRTFLFNLLKNPIYVGEIRHKDEVFQGIHEPLIDKETWDKAQRIRARVAREKVGRNKDNILTDLLFDSFGRRMSIKQGWEGRPIPRLRYYVTRQCTWGKRHQVKIQRVRADEIEQLVVTALRDFLGDRARVRCLLLEQSCPNNELDRLARNSTQAAERLGRAKREQLRLILRALVIRIELSIERVKIVIRSSEAERFLRWDGIGIFKTQKPSWDSPKTQLLDLPAGALRSRRCLAMPIEPKVRQQGPHPAVNLRQLIKEARLLQAMVDEQRDKTLVELAADVHCRPSRFARVLRLNYLAPDIITSILDGTMPRHLTCRKLIDAPLPMDWSLQRKLLGFPDQRQPEGGE